MNEVIEQQLLALNRAFYEQFAHEFAGSRSTAQPSLRRVLAGLGDGLAILDVGCGDGRVARALQEMGRSAGYCGVDGSGALIALARQRAPTLSSVDAAFVQADVVSPDWTAALPQPRYDVALCLAVLHHVPGVALRRRLVRQLAELLPPNGCLCLSTWQFMSSARLRRKIVPWAALGIAEGQVEPQDCLLTWERGGSGLRYCRFIDEQEARSLCLQADLNVYQSFLADGGLNLYLCARR